jgi:DNA-binding GntR family transcriptional regulator
MTSPPRQEAALLPVRAVPASELGGFETPPPLSEAIFRHLAREIVEGRMAPGQRLTEVQLCERFGCSRSPLREAIRMLAAESLVTLEPRRGARVARLSVKAVSDLFEVRVALECLAVRLAADARTSEQLLRLEALNAAMSEAVGAGDAKAYFALNTKFHRNIAEIGGNGYLVSLQRSAADRSFLPLFMFLSDPRHLEDAVEGHAAILSAVDARDGQAAHERMRSHILAARQEAERLVRGRLDADAEAEATRVSRRRPAC